MIGVFILLALVFGFGIGFAVGSEKGPGGLA